MNTTKKLRVPPRPRSSTVELKIKTQPETSDIETDRTIFKAAETSIHEHGRTRGTSSMPGYTVNGDELLSAVASRIDNVSPAMTTGEEAYLLQHHLTPPSFKRSVTGCKET